MLKNLNFFFLLGLFLLPFQAYGLSTAGLTDIADDKNQTAIQWLYDHNVIAGYPDLTYRPKNNINRAELLKILVGAKKINPGVNQYKNCFPDVREQWFAPFVCYAKVQGWVEGYTSGPFSGLFRPEQFINKVEAQKMLVNSQGYPVPQAFTETLKLFEDVQIGAWYYPFLFVAHDKGLLEQTSGNYGIAQFITRGEISENIYRAMIINLYGLQSFDQYQPNPTPIPPAPSPQFLQSTLLKNDLQAQTILSSSLPLNLNDSAFYSKTYVEYVNTLPYKVFVALHMIGYQNDSNAPLKSSQIIAPVLQRFQQNNAFPQSTLLSKEVLIKLDSELYKKEQQITGYSQKSGTIFESLSPATLQSQFSKDYIGWIFNYPLEVLPQHLIQNWTPSNYFMCIYTQCTGSLQKSDGTNYSLVDSQTYLQGNFIFLPDIFPNDFSKLENVVFYLQKSTTMAQVVIHEFAHYLDGNGKYSDPVKNLHIIDTTGFKEISFIADSSGNFSSCSKRKTNDIKSFITKYGYDGPTVYHVKI